MENGFYSCPVCDCSCPYYLRDVRGLDCSLDDAPTQCDDYMMAHLEWDDDADECGFDPYEGCYTYDC